MRIFSKTHDYYDSAMLGMVGDPNIIYTRNEQVGVTVNYPMDIFKDFERFEPASYFWMDRNPSIKLKRGSINFSSINILFAGKIYRPLILSQNEYRKIDPIDPVYLYNYDQLVDFLSKTKMLTQSVINDALESLNKDNSNFIEYFKNKHNVQIKDEHFLFLNSPIVKLESILVGALGSKKNAYQKVEVTKDVNLGRYQFHKQLNAFEAYQQLENYVSTVFGMQVPKIIEVSNREKIVKAGFDLKTSFRKEKEV